MGFEIISITEDVLVCKLDPKGPEPDDGRWIDLSINEKQCRALHRAGAGEAAPGVARGEVVHVERAADLTGLQPFTFYSIDVTALNATGGRVAIHSGFPPPEPLEWAR